MFDAFLAECPRFEKKGAFSIQSCKDVLSDSVGASPRQKFVFGLSLSKEAQMEKDKMCAKGDAGAEIYASLLRHGLKEPPPGVSADRRIVTKKRHYIMPVICFFFLSDFRWLFAAILFPYAAGLFRLQSATYDP